MTSGCVSSSDEDVASVYFSPIKGSFILTELFAQTQLYISLVLYLKLKHTALLGRGFRQF